MLSFLYLRVAGDVHTLSPLPLMLVSDKEYSAFVLVVGAVAMFELMFSLSTCLRRETSGFSHIGLPVTISLSRGIDFQVG